MQNLMINEGQMEVLFPMKNINDSADSIDIMKKITTDPRFVV
jgi:hypothetical protein